MNRINDSKRVSSRLNRLTVVMVTVLLVACSSATDAEEELFRDGIHTGMLNAMTEETFNRFENELGMDIHRGENPPDLSATLQNVHNQAKEPYSTADDHIHFYTSYVSFDILANMGVPDGWIVGANNDKFLYRWAFKPYDQDLEEYTIETRNWLFFVFPFSERSTDLECVRRCQIEIVGSSDWAYIMGDGSNFTIGAEVTIYERIYDPEVNTMLLSEPSITLIMMISGTITNNGIHNTKIGLIMHERHFAEAEGFNWPEGVGITISPHDGILMHEWFPRSQIIPW